MTFLTTPVAWVAIVIPTDRPKSVRNRCVIKGFGGVFVLQRCFLDFLWVFGHLSNLLCRTESDLLFFPLATISQFIYIVSGSLGDLEGRFRGCITLLWENFTKKGIIFDNFKGSNPLQHFVLHCGKNSRKRLLPFFQKILEQCNM